MRTTGRLATAAEDGWDAPAAQPGRETPEGVQDFEARRCHVCGCRFPAFGFGPPLTRKDQTVWACLAHRTEVQHTLTQKPVHGAEPGPKRLL